MQYDNSWGYSLGVIIASWKRRSLVFAKIALNNLVPPGMEEEAHRRLEILLSGLQVECRGRGCYPLGLGLALGFYVARWLGLPIRPSTVYKGLPVESLQVPRQTFHNSLHRLLEMIGHSDLFARVLYRRLGATLCRSGSLVAWEKYGSGRIPRCRGSIEEWPGPSPPFAIIWRRDLGMKLSRRGHDLGLILLRLYQVFGEDWFTAKEAGVVLAMTPQGAAKLLKEMESLGLIESRRRRQGQNMKVYRVIMRAPGDESS